MADTDQVLNLAAIIRKVDGNHSKGAAALAESILDHPGFRAVLAGEPAVPEGREPAAVTEQPNWRGLCEELVDAWLKGDDIVGAMNRARATLADEPAVPQGREPATADLEKEFRYWWKETYGSPYFGAVPLVAVLLWTECVLARWGNPAPQLPTDGEVAEVMGLFRHWAEAYPDSVTVDPYWLARAADLLQRLNPPQPVPVSERLPGPKDCDAEGRCWFGTPGCDVWGASWVLRKRSHQRNGITSWLPAHSLPLPEVGE